MTIKKEISKTENPSDNSTGRLTSLRSSSIPATATAASGRRKFVPKAAARNAAAPAASPAASSEPLNARQSRLKPNHRLKTRVPHPQNSSHRKAYEPPPRGKVTFTGAKLAGSLSSTASALNPADLTTTSLSSSSIKVCDREADEMDVEKTVAADQWPPSIDSPYQPIQLPYHKCQSRHDTPIHSLTEKEDSLFFCQLPTRLPFDWINQSSEKEMDVHSTNDQDNDASEEEDGPKTSRVLNGCAGKIQFHQSGRAILWIGETPFELAQGHTPAFCEEMVSIESKSTVGSRKKKPHFQSLGTIDQHYVFTPCFDP